MSWGPNMKMFSIKKDPPITAKIYYLHEWTNNQENKLHWLKMHARRALRFQGMEANAELEAHRQGYCVTCHRYFDKDDGS